MNRELLLEASRFSVARYEYDADGRKHTREIVEHPGSATIVPLIDGHRVCLIRNFRIAVNDWLIELPAGTREEGEPVEETARRELEEETGYRPEKIESIHEFWMSPGILNERMHLFVARGLIPTRQDLDAGEQIEPLIVPWGEALELADSGQIRDAKTIVGLLHCDRWIAHNGLTW